MTDDLSFRPTWFNKSDQRMVAAIHEAGHVVVRCYHKLVTPMVKLLPDGTGYTATAEEFNLHANVKLDVFLGGTAAEEAVLGDAHSKDWFGVEDIAWAIDDEDQHMLDCADGDVVDAVILLRNKRPEVSCDEMEEQLLASYLRVIDILQQNWPKAWAIAHSLLASSEATIHQDTIERIWNGDAR